MGIQLIQTQNKVATVQMQKPMDMDAAHNVNQNPANPSYSIEWKEIIIDEDVIPQTRTGWELFNPQR